MQQKVDETVFFKETEEKKHPEKKRRVFLFLSGAVLLVLAAVLFLMKSEYMQNQLALLKSDADYYCYVEQKNVQFLNGLITDYYESLLAEYEKSETFHVTKQMSLKMQAKSLLAALIEPYGIGTEAGLELFFTRKGEQAAITGEALAAGITYPIEVLYDGETKCYLFWPPDEEYYCFTLEQGKAAETSFMERLAAEKSLTGSKCKKLLMQYESLFFEGLSKGDIVFNKQVLRSVNEHSAYQKEFIVSITAEVLQNAVQDVFSALLKDKTVCKLYEDCRSADMPEYEEYLTGLSKELLAEDGLFGAIASIEMKVYVDNYGNVAGRDIVIHTKEDDYRIGYASVANGLSLGLEAYVQVNHVERFFADAVCKVDDGAVEGEVSVFLLYGEEMQEYELTLKNVKIMNLIAGRFSGDIFIASNHWQGVDLQISMNATNLLQELILSAYYGGAEQLNLSIQVQETEPRELPKIPEQSTEIDGQRTELLH